MNLGSNEKGLVGFSWEDIPDEIKKNKTRLTIQAYAGNGEASDGIVQPFTIKLLQLQHLKIVKM